MSDQFTPAASEPTSDDKLWSALSYVFSPIVPIIMLLMEDKKARPFIKFHAVQSLAVGVVLIILVPIIATFNPRLWVTHMVDYVLLGLSSLHGEDF